MTTGNSLFDVTLNNSYQAVSKLLDNRVSYLPWNKLTYRDKEQSWCNQELEEKHTESTEDKPDKINELSIEHEINLTKQQVELYDKASKQSWFIWAWRRIVGEDKQFSLKRSWLYYIELKNKLNQERVTDQPTTIKERKIEAIRKDLKGYDLQTKNSWSLWLWRRIFGEDSEIVLKRRWLMYQYYKENIEILSFGLTMKKDVLMLAINNLKKMDHRWLPRKWRSVIDSFRALMPEYLKLVFGGEDNSMAINSRTTSIMALTPVAQIGSSQAQVHSSLLNHKESKSHFSFEEKKEQKISETQLKYFYQKYVYLCGFFGVKNLIEVIAATDVQKLKFLQSEIASDFEHAYMSLRRLGCDEIEQLFSAPDTLFKTNTHTLMNVIKEIGHLPPEPSAYLSADEMQFAFQQGHEVSNTVCKALSTAKQLIARANALLESKKSENIKNRWSFLKTPFKRLSADTRVVVHPSVKFTNTGLQGYINLLTDYYGACAHLGLNPFDPEKEITFDMVKNAYGKLKVAYQPDKAMGEQQLEPIEVVRDAYGIALVGTFQFYFNHVRKAYSYLEKIFKKYKGPPFMLTYPPLQKYYRDFYLSEKKAFDERPEAFKEARGMIENVRQAHASFTAEVSSEILSNIDYGVNQVLQKTYRLYKHDPASVNFTAEISTISSLSLTAERARQRSLELKSDVYNAQFDELKVIISERINHAIQQLRQLQQQQQSKCLSPSSRARHLHEEIFQHNVVAAAIDELKLPKQNTP